MSLKVPVIHLSIFPEDIGNLLVKSKINCLVFLHFIESGVSSLYHDNELITSPSIEETSSSTDAAISSGSQNSTTTSSDTMDTSTTPSSPNSSTIDSTPTGRQRRQKRKKCVDSLIDSLHKGVISCPRQKKPSYN